MAQERAQRLPPQQSAAVPDDQEDLRIPATPEALATALLRGGAPRREPSPATPAE